MRAPARYRLRGLRGSGGRGKAGGTRVSGRADAVSAGTHGRAPGANLERREQQTRAFPFSTATKTQRTDTTREHEHTLRARRWGCGERRPKYVPFSSMHAAGVPPPPHGGDRMSTCGGCRSSTLLGLPSHERRGRWGPPPRQTLPPPPAPRPARDGMQLQSRCLCFSKTELSRHFPGL